MGSALPDSLRYRQPGPSGYPAPTSGKASGKASGSFLCSLFFFFPASVVAFNLGHLFLGEIPSSAGGLKGQGLAWLWTTSDCRHSPYSHHHRPTGKGMAIAGIVFGWLGVAWPVRRIALGIYVWKNDREEKENRTPNNAIRFARR